MKKFFLAVAAVIMLTACNSGPKTPVDELCDILKEGVDMIVSRGEKEASAAMEEKTEAFFEANKDYVLTDADKKKLGATMSDLMDAALKAAEKSGEIPSEQVDMAKGMMALAVSAMQEQINKTEKLGDLKDMDFLN